LISIGEISLFHDKEKVRMNYHSRGFYSAAGAFNLKYFF